jgi:CxxC-x17-CxxC domain-containing protein
MKDFKKSTRFGAGKTGGFKSGPRSAAPHPLEMHKTTCAHCHKVCEVPFRPNGKKPVFCKDCFDRDKSDAPSRPSARPTTAARPPYRTENRPISSERNNDDLRSQVVALNAKIDSLMRMVEALSK